MMDNQNQVKEKPTILIVDDDSNFLFGISRLLAKANFNVVAATNGLSGIMKARETRPDLILMDINMPKMTGFQVKKALDADQLTGNIPVVFLTALNDNNSTVAGLGMAEDYITKPVDSTILAARLKAIIHKVKSNNHEEPIEAPDETINFDRFKQWAYSVEMLDNRSIGHTSRVANLTIALARSYGITNEIKLENIYKGAFLHDIGKLAVSESIMNKPGQLTDDEWEIIRQHPAIGHQMIKSIEILSGVLDIPYCHHERWDGTGYPNRISGEAIPLAARLFAVVDVFDALTSKKPYKEAASDKDALDIISSLAGKQFDPDIAAHFVKHFDEIIKDTYAEQRRFGSMP